MAKFGHFLSYFDKKKFNYCLKLNSFKFIVCNCTIS